MKKLHYDREEPPSSVQLLSERELRVCALIARGETNKAVAAKLDISQRTVELCRQRIARKLGLKYTRDVLLWAAKNEQWLPALN